MSKPKTSLVNCPKCKTEKSIKIIVHPVTNEGVKVEIHKCSNCQHQESLESIFKAINEAKYNQQ